MAEIADKHKRDPILEGENLKKRPMLKSPKNIAISSEYEKYKEKVMLLPSERAHFKATAYMNKPKDHITLNNNHGLEVVIEESDKKSIQTGEKNQGNECKNLLSYEYALPYRNDSYSKEITKFSIAERSFVYNDVNQKDFRKKAMIFKYHEI